jgi:hypothetical protein
VPFISALAVAQPEAQETASVVLAYSAPSNVVLHQPIVANLVVQNSRPEPVRLHLGLGATQNFVVKIVRPDGVVMTAPAVPKPIDARTAQVVVLSRPLAVYTHRLVLNEWFPFDQPGNYRIEIDLGTAVETEYDAQIPATRRGVVTVRVSERDESALHGILPGGGWADQRRNRSTLFKNMPPSSWPTLPTLWHSPISAGT